MAGTTTAKVPTVVEALSSVMEEVQGIGKGERNQQQGYMFRGIDAVVNAVGPSFRRHGVVCVPVNVQYAAEHYTTAKGTAMRGITATITYRFYGPAGDFIEAQAAGESSDSGDKAMPKAHSVAYRTLLLQALCIPTDEPDPNSESHERGKDAAAGSTSGSASPDTGTLSEAEALTASLLAAAEKLGLEDTTREYAEAHKAGNTSAEHVEWLKAQLKAANMAVAAQKP